MQPKKCILNCDIWDVDESNLIEEISTIYNKGYFQKENFFDSKKFTYLESIAKKIFDNIIWMYECFNLETEELSYFLDHLYDKKNKIFEKITQIIPNIYYFNEISIDVKEITMMDEKMKKFIDLYNPKNNNNNYYEYIISPKNMETFKKFKRISTIYLEFFSIYESLLLEILNISKLDNNYWNIDYNLQDSINNNSTANLHRISKKIEQYVSKIESSIKSPKFVFRELNSSLNLNNPKKLKYWERRINKKSILEFGIINNQNISNIRDTRNDFTHKQICIYNFFKDNLSENIYNLFFDILCMIYENTLLILLLFGLINDSLQNS